VASFRFFEEHIYTLVEEFGRSVRASKSKKLKKTKQAHSKNSFSTTGAMLV